MRKQHIQTPRKVAAEVADPTGCVPGGTPRSHRAAREEQEESIPPRRTNQNKPRPNQRDPGVSARVSTNKASSWSRPRHDAPSTHAAGGCRIKRLLLQHLINIFHVVRNPNPVVRNAGDSTYRFLGCEETPYNRSRWKLRTTGLGLRTAQKVLLKSAHAIRLIWEPPGGPASLWLIHHHHQPYAGFRRRIDPAFLVAREAQTTGREGRRSVISQFRNLSSKAASRRH